MTTIKPATPLLDEMVDDMLHGDGIPRCNEWDRMTAFAKQMEIDRAELVAALRAALDMYAPFQEQDDAEQGRDHGSEFLRVSRALLAKLGAA